MTEGTKAKVLYGAEFLDFCAALRARGQYVRSVDVVGKGYLVGDVRNKEHEDVRSKMEDRMGKRFHLPTSIFYLPGKGEPPVPREVAQLWFERMKKECGCV